MGKNSLSIIIWKDCTKVVKVLNVRVHVQISSKFAPKKIIPYADSEQLGRIWTNLEIQVGNHLWRSINWA